MVSMVKQTLKIFQYDRNIAFGKTLINRKLYENESEFTFVINDDIYIILTPSAETRTKYGIQINIYIGNVLAEYIIWYPSYSYFREKYGIYSFYKIPYNLCKIINKWFKNIILNNKYKNEKTKEQIIINEISEKYKYYAIHVAGHALAAYLEGITIQFCDINAYGKPTEISYKNPYNEIKQSTYNNTIEKSIIVGYAGLAAEMLVFGEFSSCSNNNDGDLQLGKKRIKEKLILIEKNLGYIFNDKDETAEKEAIEYFNRAYRLLFDYKKLLTALSDKLKEKKNMSGDEISAFCKGYIEKYYQ